MVDSNDSLTPDMFRYVLPYGPKLRVSLECDPAEDKAVQGFKDECDINTLMSRYEVGGLPEPIAPAQYADVTGFSFEAAQEVLRRGREAFEALPARVRDRFGNNPAAMLEFVHNPANVAEAVSLGLVREDQLSGELASALAKARGIPVPPASEGTVKPT